MKDQTFDPCDDCDEHICDRCNAREHYRSIADAAPRLIEGITDAIAILKDGSDYEKIHVESILAGALRAYREQTGCTDTHVPKSHQ